MIISDKSKLMQELYAKMTQVTDAYNVTHKVMYCGDVEEVIEKFFMDKHSDWLTADKPKDEPQTCSFGLHMDCSLCWKESHCKAIKEAERKEREGE